jgi:pyrimidine-specific ribonucleoside hydrolase
MTNATLDSESSWYYSANRENINLCSKNSWITFNPGNGKNVFDYNYELDNKSMDVILESTIPLLFAGYEPSSYTHIGNIDFASREIWRNMKWLFDNSTLDG